MSTIEEIREAWNWVAKDQRHSGSQGQITVARAIDELEQLRSRADAKSEGVQLALTQLTSERDAAREEAAKAKEALGLANAQMKRNATDACSGEAGCWCSTHEADRQKARALAAEERAKRAEEEVGQWRSRYARHGHCACTDPACGAWHGSASDANVRADMAEARVRTLTEALGQTRRRTAEDDEPCWCETGGPTTHAGVCRVVRRALSSKDPGPARPHALDCATLTLQTECDCGPGPAKQEDR